MSQHLRETVAWEMGEDADDDFGWLPGQIHDLELNAIDEAIQSLNRKIGQGALKDKDGKPLVLSSKQKSTWNSQWNDWQTWITKIRNAFYISTTDIEFARKKRNDINKNLDPESFEHVQKTAHVKEIAKAPEEGESWWVGYAKYFQWKYVKWWGLPVVLGTVYVVANVYAFKKVLPFVKK